MSAAKTETFIIRWKGYPLFFHTKPCGQVYSIKGNPADATPFNSINEAWAKAQTYHLRWADITIQPLNP